MKQIEGFTVGPKAAKRPVGFVRRVLNIDPFGSNSIKPSLACTSDVLVGQKELWSLGLQRLFSETPLISRDTLFAKLDEDLELCEG